VNGVRALVHYLALALACVAAVWALSYVSDMMWSAKNYGEHHEVTVPLCRFIALILFSLGLALSGARATGALPFREVMAPLVALAAPALIAIGAALIFANEIFFSRLARHDQPSARRAVGVLLVRLAVVVDAPAEKPAALMFKL
jgi:hypothetical protein